MKILVDCCNYFQNNNNLGDAALYQAAFQRLKSLWPGAAVEWVTLDPDRLRRMLPDARPFVLASRHHWQMAGAADDEPAPAARAGPGLTGIKSRLQIRLDTARQTYDRLRFLDRFNRCDLVVGLGGGAFSDHFALHARGLLDTLEGALEHGKPAVLLSAGFEPVSDASLLVKARRVLPRLALIACRESTTGPRLLSGMGVPAGAVRVTGDHAIEPAFDLRPERLGDAIGVNLRQSDYSALDDAPLAAVSAALRKLSRRVDARLLGAPISLFGPADADSIRKLQPGLDRPIDAGEGLSCPAQVIRRIGACRVVLTGSYHSAVFALAQGIPVVGIARSLHYHTKLDGLAAQFGGTCAILDPDQPGFEQALAGALDQAWETAEARRPALLDAARAQVDAARKAYDEIPPLVGR